MRPRPAEPVGLWVPSPLLGGTAGPAPTLGLVSLADAASKHAALGFFDCLRAEVEEYDVVVSTVSPTFIRSYHVDPGQGNWEASIWKCEPSERGWRERGWGGLVEEWGTPGWRGGGGVPWGGVFPKPETEEMRCLHPADSGEGPQNFSPKAPGGGNPKPQPADQGRAGLHHSEAV